MFDSRTDLKPSRFENVSATLRGSTTIVLFAGCANVLGATILIVASWSTIQRAEFHIVFTYLASVLYGLIGVLTLWVFLSAIFHVMSALYNGEGSFRSTIVRTGIGFLPIAGSGLVNAGAIVVATRGVTFPDSPEQLGPFVQQLTTGPLFTATDLLGVGFAFWSAWIWIAGLQTARNISRGAAQKIVAVPVSVWIVWQLHPYF